MKELGLAEIVVDPTIQIRRSNHEPTIRRYEESFEKLPPVDVFDTPEGLLLADGFHRFAAAQRLGQNKVKANVHKGTREEALEFAVIANTKNADPLTPEERDDGIRRLKQLHPDWSNRKIADAMSVSEATVRAVFRVDEVKQRTFKSGAYAYAPSDTHYREIARADPEHQQPLVTATQKREWSTDLTALAVQNLRSDKVPAERKREILAGEADPTMVTEDGQLAVPAEVVGREIRNIEANDATLAFLRALEAIAKARLFRVEAILEPATGEVLDRWAKQLPGDIGFLQQVLDAATDRGKLRIVGGRE